ncbi:hypothetical protein JR316_0011092 [Psilocybe cubensis]|uniref:Uncharacterized protein n=1 Tax=Psilocybe cubensis TaxID=181762 RepID=A0ACB8GNM7_PSICU|nr:hypothetical protein JR316_0011092 [Psilocybe cubensis]KAH9477174.1 hypothetical protein JR316_0011092 [Psilocybe cubensis]
MGINRHMQACQQKAPTMLAQNEFSNLAGTLYSQQNSAYNSLLQNTYSTTNAASVNMQQTNNPDKRALSAYNEQDDTLLVNSQSDAESEALEAPDLESIPRGSILSMLDAMSSGYSSHTVDEVRIQYHPSANKSPKVVPTSQYDPHSTRHATSALPKPNHDKPWHPFATRLDFEIAELALDTHMNKNQKATLLNLIKECIANPHLFTIENASEMDKTWEFARSYRSSGTQQFVRKEFVVPYKKEEIQYEDQLPLGALPFCIVLYADKTRLSTFGTAKGYPVIARCANIPANDRNGDGLGGGRLVGWLPIVEEDSGESGKTLFINFKRIVWHKGFYEILVSIQQYATTGFHIKCADAILRWLFFFVLIISADYEEQCVIALTRGATSNYPCPICLVPNDALSNLTACYPIRSAAGMERIHSEAQKLNAKDREEHLKRYGLRNVENVFWMMNGSDVYQALSWDRLHAYHGGLFSDHLWVEFKNVIEESTTTRKDAEMVDNQFDCIPRWSGLNHFSSVIKTGEFADGSKYEDMAKLIVFASHNVLEKSDRGYCLLRLMWSFLELDMYSSLTVQSATTLAGIERELGIFNLILKEYSELHPEKNWNFPKNHSHIHMVRDIMAKGVTRNANTKPNEKAHGLLKLWYRFHTNFKNVAPQILKMNEDDLISMIIRMDINAFDENEENKASETDNNSLQDISEEASAVNSDQSVDDTEQSHVSIGSIMDPVSFESIEESHKEDHAFRRFRIKTGKCLAKIINQTIRLKPDNMLAPFQLARIHYQSIINWSFERDMVRVSASFHHQPRNDYVLIKSDTNNYCFAQLLFMYSVYVDDTPHHLALVLPFDEPIDRRTVLARKRDKDLRFLRVRARRRTNSIVIDLQRICVASLQVDEMHFLLSHPEEKYQQASTMSTVSASSSIVPSSVAGEESISGVQFRRATYDELQSVNSQRETIQLLELKVKSLQEELSNAKLSLIKRKKVSASTVNVSAELALTKDLHRLGKYHATFYRIIVPKDFFGSPRPSIDPFDAKRRYLTAENSRLANIAELYECIPAKYHSIISGDNMDLAVSAFLKGISDLRSSVLNKLRGVAPTIFPTIPATVFLLCSSSRPSNC